MIEECHSKFEEECLSMTADKCKIMFHLQNQYWREYLENLLAGVDTQVTKLCPTRKRNLSRWDSIWKIKSDLDGYQSISMKSKVCDQCIMPALTYGTKISDRGKWKAMEGSMLVISTEEVLLNGTQCTINLKK